MGSHIVAKEKIKGLTARLEKSLYKLKYGDKSITMMSTNLYNKIECICLNSRMPFPLITVCDVIKINYDTPQLFCTLSKLADEYDIILDENLFTK